ncbi:MAG: hypothetical protein IT332_11530 [Ardenticatenales bacterium]|nr:hypothetical protein [Ardenticatenales bacterium]
MSSRRLPSLTLAVTLVAALAAGCGPKKAPAPLSSGADALAAGVTSAAAQSGSAGAPGAGSDAAKRGSPTEAYHRLRDAAVSKDWGAFYDGMGPKMRAADAADPSHADLDPSLSPREKFIAGMEKMMADLGAQSLEGIGPEAFLAIWEGTAVKSEAVEGDRATLTITKDGKDWVEVFVKEDGVWRFDGVQ